MPFDGLGQLTSAQLTFLFAGREPVTEAQFLFARIVDTVFAGRDPMALARLALDSRTPLPGMPAAAARLLQEAPDPVTGLGRLEQLALEAIRSGCSSPAEIFKAASANDSHPQFWGDTTLWAKINALADRNPPLVRIEGPTPRLPQWTGGPDLGLFRISC
jgi:hypothetical protein